MNALAKEKEPEFSESDLIMSRLDKFSDRLPQNEAVQKALSLLKASNDDDYTLDTAKDVIDDAKGVITDLLDDRKKLEKKAFIDGDNGYLNKNSINDLIDHIIEEQRTNAKPDHVAIGIIDLNNLKVFNNASYGGCGDVAIKYLLKFVSERLGDKGFIARFGGDEFGVVMEGKTPEQAQKILQPILEELADVSINGDKNGNNKCEATNKANQKADIQVSASCGFSELRIFDTNKKPRNDNHGIRAEAFKLALEAQSKNKMASKIYASHLPNGYPACGNRHNAEQIIGRVLQQDFSGLGRNQFLAIKEKISEIAREHNRKPTMLPKPQINNQSFVERMEERKHNQSLAASR